MLKTLEAALGGRTIARIRDFRAILPAPEPCCDEKIFGLLDRFAADYGDGLVLYGGLAATERIYGLKRIREITTDLDFVCTPEGLEAVLDGERVAYHEDYDILFAVVQSVPVTFAYGHIHDWPVDAPFFDKAARVRPGKVELLCCSREHAVMLKLRRSCERMGKGLQPFGKDALDILNMLAGGSAREGRRPVALGELRGLLRGNIEGYESRLAWILAFLRGYEAHLSAAERVSVEASLEAISRDPLA